MLEFEGLVYLDVPKTGSTYVREFLREFSATDAISTTKHHPIRTRAEGKLYVISCRDPIEQYKSLYAFGCKGLGAFRFRLDRVGRGHLYDETVEGFSGWLNLIVTPEKTDRSLPRFEAHPLLKDLGVQTRRFLRLALPAYRKLIGTAKTKDDVKALLKSHGLMDVVLHQETLTADLAKLVSGPHWHLFHNRSKVDEYLNRSPKLNQTDYRSMDLTRVPTEILRVVQEREWLFFEVLGYRPYVEPAARVA